MEVAARKMPLYAALSYDGRVDFTPQHPDDAAVIAAINLHQRGDKGFGPALGPLAARTAVECLQRVGYRIELGAADWLLGEPDLAMQEALLSGWAVAASETGEISSEAAAEWLVDRRSAVAAQRSRIRVGHHDVFARPPGTR